MNLRPAFLCLPLLALTACIDPMTGQPLGAGPAPAPTEPAKPQPPAVSPLDVPIEIANSEQSAVSTGEAETLNLTSVVARGNEPFWSVEVRGDKAVYKTPENQKGRTIKVRRLVYAGGVELIGTLNDAPFSLRVSGTDCSDSMSGEKFPMSSKLRIGTKSNPGCAGPVEKAAS
ncbi:COG3650 family protein [Paracoccus pacificus]|uniref:COG3650 family protein n=1 Tax=Paracoccus pacificus TaxID=1463598 RepID=A0ABW4R9N4_9RHOB